MTHTFMAPAWTSPQSSPFVHSAAFSPPSLGYLKGASNSKWPPTHPRPPASPLLVLLLNEGYHPHPTPAPAPLAFTPEQFRSPSPATLARAPSSLTWMVSVASPHVSDPPGLSPHPQGLSDFTRGWSRQPLWGLIPCPLAWPGLSMPHDCWPREGTPLMLLGVRVEKVLGSCPAQKCGDIRTPEG